MYDKIVLVTRQTRLEALIQKFNTLGQAKFYIEHSGGDFKRYQQEHEQYQKAREQLQRALKPLARFQQIERRYLPNFIFGETDMVVTLGIDGLVVNTAKYLSGQPLIAINPDPAHIDGILLPFTVPQGADAVKQVMQGKAPIQKISMIEAKLNNGQRLLAFNDLFIGRHDHISAHYQITYQGCSEYHSSSGIIVSTGVGATGWMSSLFNMANSMIQAFGDGCSLQAPTLHRTSRQLLFIVREPFISKTTAATLVCGILTEKIGLTVASTMPEGGVIFSDGVLDDFLAFDAGTTVELGLAKQKVHLVQKQEAA